MQFIDNEEAKASNGVGSFLRTRTAGQRESTEALQEGCGGSGWYLSLSGEGTWMPGLRQLALALLTLSRGGCRSLEAPQANMPSNGVRNRGERTQTNMKRKTMDKQKRCFKKMSSYILKTISLRIETMTGVRMSWLSWQWCMVETCNDLQQQKVLHSCHMLHIKLDTIEVSTAAHLQGMMNPLLTSFYVSSELTESPSKTFIWY